MACAHSQVAAALDRWSECHWHIHQMEANYHEPDPFRYSLNSFIRVVKEVPQILKMELQNHRLYSSELKPAIDATKSNELLRKLSQQRDFIVHQGMLDLASSGQIGTTEGRGFKIGIGFNVAPFESSQAAYERYKAICRSDPVFRGAFGPDCDSRPFLRREWKVQELGDTELLELSVSALRALGEAISTIVQTLGGDSLDLSMSYLHDPERLKTRAFSQSEFFKTVDGESDA